MFSKFSAVGGYRGSRIARELHAIERAVVLWAFRSPYGGAHRVVVADRERAEYAYRGTTGEYRKERKTTVVTPRELGDRDV